jgi:outer membrane protein assembly factor BamB
VSVERGLLNEWQAGGPRVLWRIPVGEGFSSISVRQGRLYTLWDEGESEYLVSLDAATGKELWRHRVDGSFTNSWGNGPRSTPAVDGEVVYAVSARGKLHAVTAREGRAIWSHDLAAEYGGTIPGYGYASSPMIEDGRLFVEVGGKDDLAFIAFDKSTGEVVWASQTDAAAYSSPLAITVDGVRQVAFFSASGLFAVAPEDGRLLWQHPWDSSCPATGIPTNVAHPIFIPPDKIFVSNGYGTLTGSEVFRIFRRGEEFATETVWRSEKMRNLLNSSVLHDNYIYGFDIGILKAIDAATGEEKWKARGFERGSLIAADGKLIVLGEQGKVALVEATPSGYRERGSAQILQGKTWTAPTLAEGRLFVRNQSEMVSLDLRGNGR